MKRNARRHRGAAVAVAVLAVAVVVLGPTFVPQLRTFVDPAGLALVLGGTLVASCISRPPREVWAVLRALPELFSDQDVRPEGDLQGLLRVAEWYRRGNIWEAERELDTLASPFLRSAARLVIDGGPLSEVVKIMHWRIAGQRAREQADANVLRTMAAFAPAFGMLGTLLGLVHLLYGLGDSGLAELGAGMGFALTTTLYGIVVGNLMFKPLALKLERRIGQRMVHLGMLSEGVVLLHEKRHPTLIRETLEAFLEQRQTAVPAMQPAAHVPPLAVANLR